MQPCTIFVESPTANMVIGGFVAVIFGIPTLILLRGYLTGAESGVDRSNALAPLVVVSLFVIAGIAGFTKRDRVTVDPGSRAILWQSSTLGFVYSSERWSQGDLVSLEYRQQPTSRWSQYTDAVFVLGPKGERMIVEDAWDKLAPEARAAIEALRLPLKTIPRYPN